jgi:hypothetical protein
LCIGDVAENVVVVPPHWTRDAIVNLSEQSEDERVSVVLGVWIRVFR